MRNLLLADNFFETFWGKMLILFSTFNFWIAIFVASLGVAFFLLAKRLTRVHRANNEVVKGDKVLLTYNILGMICLIVAVVILIFFC